jgi:transposase
MTDAALADLDSLDKETLKALLIRERSSSLQQIEHLKLVIEKYRRMLFGAKSEKLVGELEQLELQLEELETSEAAEEAAEDKNTEARPSSRPRRRPRRKPLPKDLPREVVMHLPEHDCCPDCGGVLRQFGEDVSEQLERIPATFKVIRHVRPKFACNHCERVVEAPAPSRPIERGTGWTGASRSCADVQVRSPPAALPPGGDLRPRRRRSGPLHSGGMGRRDQ